MHAHACAITDDVPKLKDADKILGSPASSKRSHLSDDAAGHGVDGRKISGEVDSDDESDDGRLTSGEAGSHRRQSAVMAGRFMKKVKHVRFANVAMTMHQFIFCGM